MKRNKLSSVLLRMRRGPGHAGKTPGDGYLESLYKYTQNITKQRKNNVIMLKGVCVREHR